MKARRVLALLFEAVLVIAVASLLVGQVMGQPVLLGFVETGSMAPTMEPGDGFVAVPPAIAGDVEEGDVVTFRAQEVGGGGLTTHRVVGETDRGYVTRGDANPFPDQDGDEPPVKDAQVVAVAWTVGGSVVVIPELGTAVLGLRSAATGVQTWLAATLDSRALLGAQGITYLLAALSALGYVLDWLLDRGDRGRDRGRERDRSREGLSSGLFLAGLAAVLVVTATASMAVPAGTQSFGVVSAEFDSERPTVIRQGESNTVTYSVPNAGVVPVYVNLEPASEGTAVSPRWSAVPGRAARNATLTLHAPPETGYYNRYLREHRYLAVLPFPVVRALAGVHPWLPVLVIDAALALGVFGLGRLLFEGGRLRFRRRSDRQDRSTLRRALRWLYR